MPPRAATAPGAATAIQPTIVEGPGLGLYYNLDPRHVPQRGWAAGRNIRFTQDRVESTDGYSQFDGSPDGWPVRALWRYRSPAGGEVLLRMTTERLWRDLGPSWTPLGGPFPNRTIHQVVTQTQYRETYLATDGAGPMLYWPGTGLAGLMGQPAPEGRLLEVHKDHVLLGGIRSGGVEQPWRVAWSVVGNPFDWTGDGSGDLDFIEDATPLTALKVMGDHAIVHKRDRLWRLIFVGPPDAYIPEGIPADDGACSARSPITLGPFQYYMGHRGFYRLGSFPEPIGDAIWPEVARSIDWRQVHLVYAYTRDAYNEVCWKIPTLPPAPEGPNLTAAYNLRTQAWTVTDHDPGNAWTEWGAGTVADTWDGGDAGTAQTMRDVAWEYGAIDQATTIDLFGQLSGLLQQYGGANADGKPIEAYVESPHLGNGITPVRVLNIPMIATGNGTLLVRIRAAMDEREPLVHEATPSDPMRGWGREAAYILNPPQHRPWVDVRVYGRLYQLRFETRDLNARFSLSSYGVAAVPGAGWR
jgi:hypothetical protein